MAALFDQAKLNKAGTQRVELYEDGAVWLIDDAQHKEIKLEGQASINMFAFLLQWQEKLHQAERQRNES
jgi:hypothetical protein